MWKYLDNGSDQGTAWRKRNFNDTAWRSGAAPLGYGDPVTTIVSFGPNATSKYVTTYFRRSFQAVHGYTGLTLRVRRDDGVVVYINGTQVARSNMPSGTKSTTLASQALDGADETTFVTFQLTTTLLKGTNVIAAEVHQASRTSSDIVFDLELIGNGNTGPLR